MESNAPVQPTIGLQTLATRISWTLLILATLYACYFSHLGAIGFVGPDEPRYAWIAREMAETGDWITPRLYGKPWFEKPPLYYWGAALSFKLFGVSEAAARLPSAASALLATLVVAWLAWQLYGAETARWLLLLLPTTLAMIGFSHAAATDMPFSAMFTIAMVFAAIIMGIVAPSPVVPSSSLTSFRSSTFPASVLFGFFLGLAVLAKGPAGMILCGGAVFFWALFTKRWREAFRLLRPAAVAAFCLTALPWYILCAHSNPDFLHIFILEHNLKRYLTPEFQHIQPFWFYIPILLVALLPWTPLLLPVASELKQSLQSRRLHSSAAPLFLASWPIFPCLFFSFSQSKLPGYILPAIPPLVLLCSDATTQLLAGNRRFARAVLGSASILTVAMIAGGTAYCLRLRRFDQFWELTHSLRFWIFGLLCITGLIGSVLILSRRSRMAVLYTVATIIVFLWSATLTALDSVLSPRQTCQGLAKIRAPDEEVLLCSVPRSFVHGFNFYLGGEVPEWSQGSRKRRALVVIGSPACWSELRGANYHLRPEMDFAPWPVIEVERPSTGGLAAGREPQ